MEEDEIARFFQDLGVDSYSDIVAVLVSMYMKAESMGLYKTAEFLTGCEELGVDSMEGWKAAIKTLYGRLKDEKVFEALYRYTYGFALQRGMKQIEMESACALWEMFLNDRCGFVGEWILFLQTEKKNLNAVTKDTWDLFYDLVKQTKGDIKNFVDDGAWPSLVDAFIIWREKKK